MHSLQERAWYDSHRASLIPEPDAETVFEDIKRGTNLSSRVRDRGLTVRHLARFFDTMAWSTWDDGENVSSRCGIVLKCSFILLTRVSSPYIAISSQDLRRRRPSLIRRTTFPPLVSHLGLGVPRAETTWIAPEISITFG